VSQAHTQGPTPPSCCATNVLLEPSSHYLAALTVRFVRKALIRISLLALPVSRASPELAPRTKARRIVTCEPGKVAANEKGSDCTACAPGKFQRANGLDVEHMRTEMEDDKKYSVRLDYLLGTRGWSPVRGHCAAWRAQTWLLLSVASVQARGCHSTVKPTARRERWEIMPMSQVHALRPTQDTFACSTACRGCCLGRVRSAI